MGKKSEGSVILSYLPCVWTDRTCRPDEVGTVLSVSAVTEAEVLILWVICRLVVGAADKKRNVLLTAQSVTATTTANMSFSTLQHYLLPLLLLLSLLFAKLLLKKTNSYCDLESPGGRLSLHSVSLLSNITTDTSAVLHFHNVVWSINNLK